MKKKKLKAMGARNVLMSVKDPKIVTYSMILRLVKTKFIRIIELSEFTKRCCALPFKFATNVLI